MKKLSNFLSTILLIIVVILAILLAGVRVIGLTPYTVLSGSMEPTYHTGSLIYVEKAAPESIKENDPITFYMADSKTIVTHRAVAVNKEEKTFTTKGDANNVEDAQKVPFQSLIGAPKFTIPYLGYLSVYLSTKTGKLVAGAVVLLILALTFIPDIFSKKQKEETSNEE